MVPLASQRLPKAAENSVASEVRLGFGGGKAVESVVEEEAFVEGRGAMMGIGKEGCRESKSRARPLIRP